MNLLFTIGHSNHSLEAFLALLARHEVTAIADVRSQPLSRRFPWFSKEPLQASLKAAGIQYVFLGRELGARREECECYIGNTVSFEQVAAAPLFAAGLVRLKEGMQNYRTALLCAEKDPLDCHRTILIARQAATFATIRHILADGSLEAHEDSERRLLAEYQQSEEELFCSHQERLAQAYDRRASEIAWGDPGIKKKHESTGSHENTHYRVHQKKRPNIF